MTPWPRHCSYASCRASGRACSSAVCLPCLHGFCDILPHAQLVPGIDTSARSYVVARRDAAAKVWAYNPGRRGNANQERRAPSEPSSRLCPAALFVHRDRLFTTLRLTNYNWCPERLKQSQTGRDLPLFSEVAMCELLGLPPDMKLESCRHINVSGLVASLLPAPYRLRPE